MRAFTCVVALLFGLHLCACASSPCTSHPYDPKAACAAPGAQLGPADAGPQEGE